MKLNSLFYNIRFYVLVGSFLLSIVLWVYVRSVFAAGQLQIIRLEQFYGFVSIVLLYFTLLAGPFCFMIRSFPYRKQYLLARRALGVSAFYFALLHTVFTFFGQLGGFGGLAFLSSSFTAAIVSGFVALGIFFLLTITSLDYAVEKLGFAKWKLLHRLVYLAGILIIVHTFMLGTHFSNLSGIISQVSFWAIAALLLFESPRIDVWIQKYFFLPQFGITTVVFATILGVIYFTFFFPLLNGGTTPSFDIHAVHRQLAAQALNQSQQTNVSNLPGLNGDRTKRYTVSLISPNAIVPNMPMTFRFHIYDASNGDTVSLLRILYAKPMHLIVTDSTLSYFAHIHPVQDGNEWVVKTQFPTSGMYHLYISFQPFGGIEQQDGFTVPVGVVNTAALPLSTQPVDKNLTKTFGNYEVILDTHGKLTAQDMSLGNDTISFTIRDAKTKRPISTLKPYLDSFGHLTMVNEATYDYIHVHPYSLIIPPANANGGPTVDFLPIGIYGPFKAGIYRVFAEFNPDGNLFMGDFTIRVE